MFSESRSKPLLGYRIEGRENGIGSQADNDPGARSGVGSLRQWSIVDLGNAVELAPPLLSER